MTRTVIVITQSYLKFSSAEVWDLMQRSARIILIMAEGEKPLPMLAGVASRVVHVSAQFGQNVTPILAVDEMLAAIEEELARGTQPDEMRLICQDECNLVGVALCRQSLNIPGDPPEMVSRFRDKIEMKQALVGSGVRIPRHEPLDKSRLHDSYIYYDELVGRLGAKLVLKPRDAAGSLGVKIISDADGFDSAMRETGRVMKQFEYEVDEFIEGKMYQCDSFTLDGKVVFASVLELNCSNFDFVGGKPLAVFPVPNGPLKTLLAEMNEAVIAALGYTNGSTHHEIFLEEQSQEAVFLEIAARVPGGIGVPFHLENSGVNLIDLVLLLNLGKDFFRAHFAPRDEGGIVYALLPLRRGKIFALDEPDVESPYEINWNVAPGDIVDPQSLVDTAGILVLRNNDRAALRRDFDRLGDYSPVRTAGIEAQVAE